MEGGEGRRWLTGATAGFGVGGRRGVRDGVEGRESGD